MGGGWGAGMWGGKRGEGWGWGRGSRGKREKRVRERKGVFRGIRS